MTLGHVYQTKKHERGVVAALDVEVRQPTRRVRSSLCPSVCTVAWFAIAATFAGLFGWSFDAWKALEAAERHEIDVSGYGQCNGTQLAKHGAIGRLTGNCGCICGNIHRTSIRYSLTVTLFSVHHHNRSFMT